MEELLQKFQEAKAEYEDGDFNKECKEALIRCANRSAKFLRLLGDDLPDTVISNMAVSWYKRTVEYSHLEEEYDKRWHKYNLTAYELVQEVGLEEAKELRDFDFYVDEELSIEKQINYHKEQYNRLKGEEDATSN